MNRPSTFRDPSIFLGIIAAILLCAGLYDIVMHTRFVNSFRPLGDSALSYSTWLDKNGNGVRDRGEPPLGGVCVGYTDNPEGVSESITGDGCIGTDSHGKGGPGFLAGWSGPMYVFAIAPAGYQPTTDMVVNMEAATGYSTDFGFVQEGVPVQHKVETVADFSRRQFITKWMRNLATGFFILVVAGSATIWVRKHLV